jgi:hypothetical protein
MATVPRSESRNKLFFAVQNYGVIFEKNKQKAEIFFFVPVFQRRTACDAAE